VPLAGRHGGLPLPRVLAVRAESTRGWLGSQDYSGDAARGSMAKSS
jgi:hypothetical protein